MIFRFFRRPALSVIAATQHPVAPIWVSCLEAQRFRDFEVLLSGPGAVTRVSSRGYRVLTRTAGAVRRSRSAAVNEAVRRASGEYVCLLPDGVVPDADYLEQVIEVLEARRDVSFVSSWGLVGAGRGRLWCPERCDLATLLAVNTISPIALARRSAVLYAGGLDEAAPDVDGADWLLWLELVRRNCAGWIIQQPLFRAAPASFLYSGQGRRHERHLELAAYVRTKYEPYLRDLWLDALLAKERIIGALLRANDRAERRAFHLEQDIEKKRVELSHGVAGREGTSAVESVETVETAVSHRGAAVPGAPGPETTRRPTGVAAIVVCYNLGRTLEEAVESILRQSTLPDEILIVDDGSDEPATHEALKRVEERGQRVLRTENRGVSAARNTGISKTTAPFILLLDADDWLDPEYVRVTRAFLEAHPEIDFVSTGMRGFEGSSYVWAPPQPELVTSMTRGVVHNSSLMRRDVWLGVGGYDEECRAFEELDFWTTVMAKGYRGYVLDEPLLNYRVRPDSLYHLAIREDTHTGLMERFYRKHRASIASHLSSVLAAKDAFILEQDTHCEHVEGVVAARVDRLAQLDAEDTGSPRPE